MFQIIDLRESSFEEKKAATLAMFACHTIQDNSDLQRSVPLLKQEKLLQVMQQAFILFPVDQMLAHVTFMLPKIREIRPSDGLKESAMDSKQIVELCLSIVNQAYKLSNISDRFYVLLVALRKLVQCSLTQIMDGNKSSTFDIYNFQWFISLWNDQPVEVIPSQFKEELSMTLIEATLQAREDIVKSVDLSEGDAVLNVSLMHWITVCLEIAEIACKVLDWQTPNPKYNKQKDSSGFGIQVCKQYLHLMEEISLLCDKLGNEVRKKQIVKTQQLLFEVFKRVVNDEILLEINNESLGNLDEI